METLFSFLFIFFGIVFSIVYLIIKAISYKAEKKGRDLLQYLRNNTYDVRKILGEMRFIAEVNFEQYDEYISNKVKAKESIIGAFSVFRKQDKLLLAMNRNVKAEWTPRFKFLKEIQNSFDRDIDLNNAFIECKKIDSGMRKTTLWNINLMNFYEDTIKKAKFALKVSAFGAIAGIAIVGVMQGMVNNAGRDIGYSPKSNKRYQDPETGNLFDEDGNRVPW